MMASTLKNRSGWSCVMKMVVSVLPLSARPPLSDVHPPVWGTLSEIPEICEVRVGSCSRHDVLSGSVVHWMHVSAEESPMKSRVLSACVLSCAVVVALTACGRGESAQSLQIADEHSAAVKAAQLEAREQQLAQREAELEAREAEQAQALWEESETAQREAAKAAAAKEAAAKEAAAKKAAQARLASAAPAERTSAPVKTAEPTQPAMEVQAGTELIVALASELSTKTAKVGDAFEATLVADLMSGERRVAPAGARVTGTITEVVSGSHAIGAVPTLGLRFERLELADGRHIPIRGEIQQQGDSEKGRDAAKIIGGAAAGAVIGHQIKHGTKGKVIGGLLGGAAGAVVAKNTGTEVQLPQGSQLTIVLGEGFVVASR